VTRPPTDRREVLFRALALAVILSSLALRLWGLDRFSLGNDEIQEVRWSRLPLSEMLGEVGRDGVHPPLEYLVQMLVSRAGGAEWAHRLPGVLAGTGGIVLMMFLARRWFGRTAALAAGALLCLSPIHLRYSQEVRPYALGLLFLTSCVAALEAYRERPRRGIAVLWFVSVAAAMYTLYFAGLVAVLVSVLYLFLYRRETPRALWRRLPRCLAGWCLLSLAWLPVVVAAARRPLPPAGEALDAGSWSHRLQALGTGDWRLEPLSLGSLLFWALVGIGLARAWKTRPAAVAGGWLLIGTAAEFAILRMRPHFPAVRYYLPSWLGAVLLAGGAAAVLSHRRAGRAAAALALCGIAAYDVRALREYYDHGRPRWQEVAVYCREHVRSGERLVGADGWVRRNLGYYWTDEGQGLPGVPLEWPGARLKGPAWLVVASCQFRPELRESIEALEARAFFPLTNHCVVRFVPEGTDIATPDGLCLSDF
jgi:mannosyltransferase